MTPRRDDLFPVLEPPPGGLALLRERLARRKASHAWWWFGGVPALAACAVALVFLVRPDAPNPLSARLASDPFAMALGLSPSSGAVEVAQDARANSAVRQVASGNPDVVIYWFDATREEEP